MAFVICTLAFSLLFPGSATQRVPFGGGSALVSKEMKYYVYILQSLKDKRFYIGCTVDLKKRLIDHNCGKNKSTRYRRPFKLVYHEEFNDKHLAFKREFFLKSPKGFLEKKRIISKFIFPG